MLLAVSKILPPLFFPLGLTILLCVLAAVLAFRKDAVRAGGVSLLAAAVLYLAANPLVSHRLMTGLEQRHLPAEKPPAAAAIVLLGGGVLPDLPPRVYPETNWAGDRLLHAGRLWKQGAAPLIVATGGYIPYLAQAPVSEAHMYSRLLEELFDVPPASILPVPDSRNTREDAVMTARMFGERDIEKEILLVTSAAHMPRAIALFRGQGFVVHPAPTDFNAVERRGFMPMHLLPSGIALAETHMALHEYAGLLVYRLLGWI